MIASKRIARKRLLEVVDLFDEPVMADASCQTDPVAIMTVDEKQALEACIRAVRNLTGQPTVAATASFADLSPFTPVLPQPVHNNKGSKSVLSLTEEFDAVEQDATTPEESEDEAPEDIELLFDMESEVGRRSEVGSVESTFLTRRKVKAMNKLAEMDNYIGDINKHYSVFSTEELESLIVERKQIVTGEPVQKPRFEMDPVITPLKSGMYAKLDRESKFQYVAAIVDHFRSITPSFARPPINELSSLYNVSRHILYDHISGRTENHYVTVEEIS